MVAVISLFLVVCSRLVTTWASRRVTSYPSAGSDVQHARTARASNSKASTGLAATAPKAHVNIDVHGYVAGLNQPEAGGVTALLKEPVPGWDGDVRGDLGEPGQVVLGYAVQERVGGQSRRCDLDHGISPPASRPK